MSRSEFDANQALLALADDPLEQTQRMPVADRRYRQNEARVQSWRARDERIMQERVDAEVDRRFAKYTRTAFDTLVNMPPALQLTIEEADYVQRVITR